MAAYYGLLKQIHVATVIISLILFVLRGLWMLGDVSLLQRRWVKVVPHVNDTLLLLSALALSVILGQYPFAIPWLTAKVVGLVVYIGLGMVALKWGPTKPIRAVAWIAALLVFGYIVSVAIYRSPWGFLVI